MSTPRRPRFTLSTLCAATLLAFATHAGAAPVLGASSTAQAPAGNNGTTTANANNSATYQGSSSSASVTAGNAYGYSFANQYGAYAVSTTATGTALGSAHASLLYTLTNTSGVSQSYTMSFHLYGGSISAGLSNNASLIGSESLSAQYAASIKVNGSSVFSSGATVTRNTIGVSLDKTGTDLNSSNTSALGGYYSWSAKDFLLDLGTLAAGASFDVLAEVDDASTANVGIYNYGGGGGYGYGCNGTASSLQNTNAVVGGDTNVVAPPCFKGTASAFYGDPVNFGSSNSLPAIQQVSFDSVPVDASVPEPATLALVAAALLGAGAAGRRRRALATSPANSG